MTPAGSESELNGTEDGDVVQHLNTEKGDCDESSTTRDLDTNGDSASAEEDEVDPINGEDTTYIPMIELPVLCVMRHSTRLDVAMHEWNVQNEGNEEEEEEEQQSSSWPEHWPEWPDQQTR